MKLLALVTLAATALSSLFAAEPLPTQVRIRDGGAHRTFELLERRQAAGEESIVLFPKGGPRTQWTRRVLTTRIHVELAPGGSGEALAARFGVKSGPELEYAPGHYVFKASSPRDTLRLAETLKRQPQVLSAEPILARRLRPKVTPNDPLFRNQWHLRNTGQQGATVGLDIKIQEVWDRFRGRGVTVAIVDDGLLYTHPDLEANVNVLAGIDIRDADADPLPEGAEGAGDDGNPLADSHGTAVAGLAAAVGNNGLGVTGVAYQAQLVGIRLIGGNSGDDQEAEAVSYLPGFIHVSNNSWGSDDDGQTMGGAGELVLLALKSGVTLGRGGKGTVYVWAAGNGGEALDNANYDSYVNSIYTLAVGAINDRGARASYSERGSCLVVSGPGGNDARRFQGMTTTDLAGEFGYNWTGSGTPALPELEDLDYTQNFNGTSAAAPIVSGVVALVLEANRNLGWRDVQEILIRSATRIEPESAQWLKNGAGLWFNHDFGAGLVNAKAAVDLATTWVNLGPQANAQAARKNLSVRIPEDGTSAELSWDLNSSHLRVEHVTVHIQVSHQRRGDLAIELVSPSGTVSRLAELHEDPNADVDHTFMSVFNWGESSTGTWTLRLSDQFEDVTGSLTAATLTVYGTPAAVPQRPRVTPLGVQAGSFKVRVAGQQGKLYELQSTRDFSSWQPEQTLAAPSTEFELSGRDTSAAWKFYRVVEK